MGHWLSHSLLRFKLIIVLIISCCFISCSSDTSSSFDDEISTISLSSIPDPNSYIIYVDGDQAGTATLSVTGGFLYGGQRCSQIQEDITINDSSATINTYAKDLESNTGYYIVTDDSGLTDDAYIPFPLDYLSQMTGYFGIMTDDLITLTMINFHSSYTNKNGHSFTDVAEYSSDNDLIKLFVNANYFIIQKEDYRYAPTIQSLSL